MDEELRKRRSFVIGHECKRWFKIMLLMFTGRDIDIPENVAFSIFMQGQAMCAFGEYILEPTDENLLFLNNAVHVMGENFEF